jgi:TatD DNase family protein
LSSAPYLDIHTHRRDAFEGVQAVECLTADELLSGSVIHPFISAGVHPWWIEDYTSHEIEIFKSRVEALASAGKLWAIGEAGIDRAYPEFLDAQKDLFAWHVDLAEKYKLPMVIHSVRSGADFLEILKTKKPQSPWIFHDFRGSEQLVKDLLRLHPQTFFSFGLSLDNSPQVRELIPLIPLQNLFLETDSQKHLDIHDIFLRAAESLKIDIEFLKAQVWLNFRKLTPSLA